MSREPEPEMEIILRLLPWTHWDVKQQSRVCLFCNRVDTICVAEPCLGRMREIKRKGQP
jgi:hypothetical protein